MTMPFETKNVRPPKQTASARAMVSVTAPDFLIAGARKPGPENPGLRQNLAYIAIYFTSSCKYLM